MWKRIEKHVTLIVNAWLEIILLFYKSKAIHQIIINYNIKQYEVQKFKSMKQEVIINSDHYLLLKEQPKLEYVLHSRMEKHDELVANVLKNRNIVFAQFSQEFEEIITKYKLIWNIEKNIRDDNSQIINLRAAKYADTAYLEEALPAVKKLLGDDGNLYRKLVGGWNLLVHAITNDSEFMQHKVKYPFSAKAFPTLIKFGIKEVKSLTEAHFAKRKENEILFISDTGYLPKENGVPIYSRKPCFILTDEIFTKYKYQIIDNV